jgi:hypothetical protein
MSANNGIRTLPSLPSGEHASRNRVTQAIDNRITPEDNGIRFQIFPHDLGQGLPVERIPAGSRGIVSSRTAGSVRHQGAGKRPHRRRRRIQRRCRFSVTGPPAGLTASFSPSTVAAPGTRSSTLTLSAAANLAPGVYNLTVKSAHPKKRGSA